MQETDMIKGKQLLQMEGKHEIIYHNAKLSNIFNILRYI